MELGSEPMSFGSRDNVLNWKAILLYLQVYLEMVWELVVSANLRLVFYKHIHSGLTITTAI